MQFILCRLELQTLMNCFFVPISRPHLHVILHAGLARSCRIHCFNKWGKTFSLGRRCTPNGWGVGESDFFWPSPTFVCDGPPSPGERGLSFGRMDSATSPSAPRRMTGQRHTAKDESFQLQEAHPKGNLLLCALILDWCYVHWYWVNVECIGIGLMLYVSALDWR